MRNYLTALVTLLTIGACSSGPSDSTKLSDLTTSEAQDLCEESIGTRTITCNGTTFTLETTQADCDAATADEIPASCPATVGDFRDCQDAIDDATDAQLCEGLPTACAAVSACSDS